MSGIVILSAAALTAVGLDRLSTAAAIRCGIHGAAETRFLDRQGEWLMGCTVPLEPPHRGLERIIHFACEVVSEAMSGVGGVKPDETALFLCVAEKERPGRIAGLDEELRSGVEKKLSMRFHPASSVIAGGRVGGAQALGQARLLLSQKKVSHCLIVGVDSFLVAATLDAYEAQDRLLTSANSNGFIPGEAAAAVLLSRPYKVEKAALTCSGLGFGIEKASILSEGKPLRGDGLVEAFRQALGDADRKLVEMDYRISDLNGEQYGFKEASLALTRSLLERKVAFEVCHPADCIGEIGAAIVPCALVVAFEAARKEYAPGPWTLCHFGNDDGQRAALILHYKAGK